MKSTIMYLVCLSFLSGLMAQSGITWNPTMNVNNMTMYGNQRPRIVLDRSGDPMILWGNSGNNNAYFSKWNGTGFTTPMVVNTSFPVFAASWAGPDIASNGDTLYIVVKETPEITNPAYIFASFDGGNTFSTASQVDLYLADSISRFPTVTVDNNGQPIVAYMKINPDFLGARWVVTRSNDFGNTFTVDQLASGWSGGDVCDCCPSSITNSGNTVIHMYRDNNSNIRDMWAGMSTDGGNTFTSGFYLDNPGWMLMMCPSSGPDGDIIGNKLHSVLMSGASGDYLIYHSITDLTSQLNDTTYAITGLLPGLSSQNYPRMATDGSAVGIIWKQAVSGQDQLPLIFTNNINSGFPANYDTVDLDNITNADIAINDGMVHIVWEDAVSGTVKYRSGTYQSVLSVDEEVSMNFVVYPNPATNEIELQIPEGVNEFSWEIVNLNGEIVKSGEKNSNGNFHIVVSDLAKGNYYVRIYSEDKSGTQVFIKQ